MLRVCRFIIAVYFLSRDGKHKFYAVFLIHGRSARIVIYGKNIRLGVKFAQSSYRAFCNYMIRQTAERLRAKHVVVPFFYKFGNFPRKQPALAHFYAAVDNAVGKFFDFFKRNGGNKIGIRFNRVNHKLLVFGGFLFYKSAYKRFNGTSAVIFTVGLNIRRAILKEPQHAGNHIFAPLRKQKLFKPAVCERRIFNVNFAHYSHFYKFFVFPRDIVKVFGYFGKIFFERFFMIAFLLRKL